ncbi:MAG: PCMD domain-containing protein [Bacteroidales bacterium]|nr:PCMD domain-containing protein [Bacteroidales bacterium]
MRRFLHTAFLLSLAAWALQSCISNDLPYPVIRAAVSELETPDGEASIDAEARVVELTLREEADLSAVRIGRVEFNDPIVRSSVELTGTLDLRKPLPFTLSTYQDYEWLLRAVKPVERYCSLRSQVGETLIDDVNRRVVVTVGKRQSLKDIHILSLKLGPQGCSYEPEPSEIRDFREPVEITVSWRGEREVWTVYVDQTDVVVDFRSVDAWARVAWLSALAADGEQNGFRYRREGEEEWIDAGEVSQESGSFSACVEGLEPETAYEFVAYSGNHNTEIRTVSTEAEGQLPNSGFEVSSNDESSNYRSFYDPLAADEALRSKWWDNGNAGSTTAGASYTICRIDTEDFIDGAASAQLVSRNVIIKFAAGNLFSGSFAGLVGTSGGIVDFGRPFTLHPRALSLWVKYECGAIDCIGSYPEGDPVREGDPDRGQIFVALGDWDYREFGGTPESPVRVNTTKKSTFFNPSSPAVIAYGGVVFSESTGGWKEIEIPLEYNSVSRRPTHIIVSCASSMLGDYFTGSSTSKMWLDDLRLIY